MRLEPLYRIRFTYPEQWGIELGGDWEQHFAIAEGRCQGSVSGRFRGANFPRRRGDGTFRPDFRAVIETDDDATIMFEWHGYGRAYPIGRREIVGAIFHLSDDDRYSRLNDIVCACVGGHGRAVPLTLSSTLPSSSGSRSPTSAEQGARTLGWASVPE